MQRAIEHVPAGSWPKEQASGSVTLDFDARHRRRIRLGLDAGGHVLLDLPRAVAMADGDALALEGGGWIEVRAAAEPVIEIRCSTPLALARVAWHLGNRHLPTEIRDGGLRIRPDHVIEEMLVRLGAELTRVTAAFQPEGGAYGREPNGRGDGEHHHHHHHHRRHEHGASHER